MGYKETFSFLLWEGKPFASITNVMANEERRINGSFGGMKFKKLKRNRQHDDGDVLKSKGVCFIRCYINEFGRHLQSRCLDMLEKR